MTPIITDIAVAREKGLLKDGRYFVKADDGTPMFLPIWYGNRLDLQNMLVTESIEEIDVQNHLPSLSDLVRPGAVKEATLYRCHEIRLPKFTGCYEGPAFTGKLIRELIAEFREHGFNVTRKALLHNYGCWFSDLKSGYRDEANGYHLFTPCGCNQLCFRATSLCDDLDWQTTYEW